MSAVTVRQISPSRIADEAALPTSNHVDGGRASPAPVTRNMITSNTAQAKPSGLGPRSGTGASIAGRLSASNASSAASAAGPSSSRDDQREGAIADIDAMVDTCRMQHERPVARAMDAVGDAHVDSERIERGRSMRQVSGTRKKSQEGVKGQVTRTNKAHETGTTARSFGTTSTPHLVAWTFCSLSLVPCSPCDSSLVASPLSTFALPVSLCACSALPVVLPSSWFLGWPRHPWRRRRHARRISRPSSRRPISST